MHWKHLSVIVPLCGIVAAGCSSRFVPDVPTSPIGEALSESLGAIDVWVGAEARLLEHDLFEPAFALSTREVNPETCGEVAIALQDACNAVMADGYEWCFPQASYFYANLVPRCAGRIVAVEFDDDLLPEIWAFDLSGEPYDGPAPECGNGLVEPGEQCDDGNNEIWDGCDSYCYWEAFGMCEAVIEYYFATREVAVIDQQLWDGPRTHLMRHTNAVAIRDVTDSSCNDALGAAADVCNELAVTMPFVGWCQPTVELLQDEIGLGCAVRFEVGFQSIDPDSGVYTLDMSGILAFTIR